MNIKILYARVLCILYIYYGTYYLETINPIASEMKKGRQFQYLLSRLSTIIYCNSLQITIGSYRLLIYS